MPRPICTQGALPSFLRGEQKGQWGASPSAHPLISALQHSLKSPSLTRANSLVEKKVSCLSQQDSFESSPPPSEPQDPPSSLQEDPEQLLMKLLMNSYLEDGEEESLPIEKEGALFSDEEKLRKLAQYFSHSSFVADLAQAPFLSSFLLASFPSLELAEGVVTLLAVCKKRGRGGRESLAFISDGLAQCLKKNEEEEGEELFLQALSLHLGKWVYRLDRGKHCDELFSLSPQEAFEGVCQFYQQEMSQASLSFDQQILSYRNSGLQDPFQARVALVPQFIAELLLCQGGEVNVGILMDVHKRFSALFPPLSPHRAHLDYALCRLKHSPSLRHSLYQLGRRPLAGKEAEGLVRILLGRAAEDQVTAKEVRLAGLTTLLSYMSAGESRSCFASALAIVLLASDLAHCLEDFEALLEKGGLVRMVQGEERIFPLLLRMGRTAPYGCVTLSPEGYVTQPTRALAPFWESPGFRNACSALAIADVEGAGKEVWQALLGEQIQEEGSAPPRFYVVTISDLLEKLVLSRLQKGEGREEKNRLLALAVFAFESRVDSALLRVWENSIASMAEASHESFNRSWAVKGIRAVLARKIGEGQERGNPLDLSKFASLLDKLFPSLPEKRGDKEKCSHKGNILEVCRQHPDLRPPLLAALDEQLEKRVHLIYDPSIPSGLAGDGQVSQGGFRLWDQDLGEVRGPEDFKRFVSLLIDELATSLETKEGAPLPFMKEAIRELKEYVEQDDFVLQTLKRLDESHHKTPLESYEELELTPWCFKAGSNFRDLLPVYFGVEKRPEFTWIQPSSAENLMESLAQVIQQQDGWVQESDHPRKLIPARVQGMHVFSLMLDHPSMDAFVRTQERASWIQERMIRPGEKIAHSSVSPVMRMRVMEFCLEELPLRLAELGCGKQPSLCEGRFLQLLQELPKELSMKAFRDVLVNCVCERCALSQVDERGTVELLIDEALVRFLPQKEKKALEGSAVHFAETGWLNRRRLRAIHFCMLYNPGSMRLEMAKIDEDGRGVQFLSQKEWLKERPWEVCCAIHNVFRNGV